MTNPKNYVYPDINDSLTIQMIGEVEQETGMNWGDGEQIVLDELMKIIRNYTKKSDSLLVDFGCGEGRLLPEFEKFFEKIIAIEPDKTRLENAIKSTKESNIFDKTTFINESVENVKIPEPADVILISHIIQHVKPEVVSKIIDKAYMSLKNGGILYLATNNLAGNRDKFTKSYRAKDKLLESRINREEFISLVNNNSGILPIHWFSQKNLIKKLIDDGFEIIYSQTFHGSKNSPDRDLAVIAIKKNSS